MNARAIFALPSFLLPFSSKSLCLQYFFPDMFRSGVILGGASLRGPLPPPQIFPLMKIDVPPSTQNTHVVTNFELLLMGMQKEITLLKVHFFAYDIEEK